MVKDCLHGTTATAWDEEAARVLGTRATIESLGVPFLALQGQLDANVDPTHIAALREPLSRRDAEVHIVEGVGHTLVHDDETGSPRIAPEVNGILRDFLRSVPLRETKQ